MDEIIRRSKAAQDFGADGLMILPPYLEGPADDDGIFEFYAAIDRAVDADIIGYNIPQSTGLEMSAELYGRLLELEHFNYIKDSSENLSKQQALIRAGGAVLNGGDPITPFAMMAGSPGAIWGAANSSRARRCSSMS